MKISAILCIVNSNKRGPYFSSKGLLPSTKRLPPLILTSRNAVACVINTNKFEIFMTSHIVVLSTLGKVCFISVHLFLFLYIFIWFFFSWQNPRRLTVNGWTNKVSVPLSSLAATQIITVTLSFNGFLESSRTGTDRRVWKIDCHVRNYTKLGFHRRRAV